MFLIKTPWLRGILFTIHAGYVHEVKKNEVVVLLDRDLTKRYMIKV